MPRYLTAYSQPDAALMVFLKGEHHLADETAIPEGFCRRATNFSVSSGGVLVTRGGEVPTTLPGGHSMFTTANGTTYYVTTSGELVTTDFTSVLPVVDRAGAPVLITADRLWWGELNGEAYYSSAQGNGRIDAAGRWRSFGVPNYTVPWMSPGADVSVAVVYVDVDGEESGAVVVDSGYQALSNHPYTKRLYVAEKGSTVYRRLPDGVVPTGYAWEDLVGITGGAVVQTMNLEPMPRGEYLTFAHGRSWVGVGNCVFYSEPMRYGLTNAAFNFVPVPADVTAVGAAVDGMYFGTPRGMYFLDGTDPDKAELKLVNSQPVFRGSQVTVHFADLNMEGMRVGSIMSEVGAAFCVLTPAGYAFCLPSGVVRTPMAGYAALGDPGEVRTTLITNSGSTQLVSNVQSTPREVEGVATDSLMSTQ